MKIIIKLIGVCILVLTFSVNPVMAQMEDDIDETTEMDGSEMESSDDQSAEEMSADSDMDTESESMNEGSMDETQVGEGVEEASEEDEESMEESIEVTEELIQDEALEEQNLQIGEDEVEVDFEEETLEGEVVEVGEDYFIIEDASGEQQTIRRGGGGLLSPYVRAQASSIAVGDVISVEVTDTIIADAIVAEKPGPTTFVIVLNGERQTFTQGQSGVTVRQNGRVVTDFSEIETNEEVEITIEANEPVLTEMNDAPGEGSGSSIWIWLLLAVIIIAGVATFNKKKSTE